MGDALPPAAMALFSQFGPISSMNWTVNMLTETPATDDGWWLLSAKTGYARHGLSVQDMMLWNRAGEPVLSGSQAIAIYARTGRRITASRPPPGRLKSERRGGGQEWDSTCKQRW